MSSKNRQAQIKDIIEKKGVGAGGFILQTDEFALFMHLVSSAIIFGIPELTMLFKGKEERRGGDDSDDNEERRDDPEEEIMEIMQMDTAHIMMFGAHIFRKSTTFYKTSNSAASIQISLKATTLLTALKTLNKLNNPSLYIRLKSEEANSVELLGVSGEGDQLLIELILYQVNIEELSIPEFIEDFRVIMPSTKFNEIISAFHDFSCASIEIYCSNDEICFSSGDASVDKTGGSNLFSKFSLSEYFVDSINNNKTIRVDFRTTKKGSSTVVPQKKRPFPLEKQAPPPKKQKSSVNRKKANIFESTDEEDNNFSSENERDNTIDVVVKEEFNDSESRKEQETKLVRKETKDSFACKVFYNLTKVGSSNLYKTVILRITQGQCMEIKFLEEQNRATIQLYLAPMVRDD